MARLLAPLGSAGDVPGAALLHRAAGARESSASRSCSRPGRSRSSSPSRRSSCRSCSGSGVGVGLSRGSRRRWPASCSARSRRRPSRRRGASFWSRALNVLRDPAFWRQQAHVLLAWPIALVALAARSAGRSSCSPLPVYYRWADGVDVFGLVDVDTFAGGARRRRDRARPPGRDRAPRSGRRAVSRWLADAAARRRGRAPCGRRPR